MNFRSLPRILTGDAFRTPEPDNNNWMLKPDWRTPAEFTQWVNREKARLRARLAADPGLLNDRKFRLDWDVTIAIERCAAWHLYGRRQPAELLL